MFLGSHCLSWLWHLRLGPRVTLRLTLRSSSSLSGSLFGSPWLTLAGSGLLAHSLALSGSTLAHSLSLIHSLTHYLVTLTLKNTSQNGYF